MLLEDWIQLAGDDRATLLRDAGRVAAHLPPATEAGGTVALAFGRDARAFRAGLLAAWLRGYGAAVVENDLRERIMPVLEHPSVRHLLHDTGSGRAVQVPHLLEDDEDRETPAPLELCGEAPSPMLLVHVQDDDGEQTWCSWSASELADAADAVGRSEVARTDDAATPGKLAQLFCDTLAPLRGAGPLGAALGRVDAVEVPGAPSTRSRHEALLEALSARDGVDDVAVVLRADGRPLIALAGPNAQPVAAEVEDATALDVIPRDPNGQAMRPALYLQFGLGRSGRPVTRSLTWEEVSRGPDEATFRATIPADYLFYEGHFDGYPVLAGGVQLHELVLPRLRALVGPCPGPEQLDGVKFLARFVPGETVDVTLRRQEDARKVTFTVQRGETRCTTGRMTFAAPVAAFAPDGDATARGQQGPAS